MKRFLILSICVLISIFTFSQICGVSASEFFSREIICSLEFESSLEGAREDMCRLENGTLFAKYVDSKPVVYFNSFETAVSAVETDYMTVGISSENNMMLKFYFITDKNSDWSEDRAFSIKPEGGSVMNEYTVNVSGISNWKDNITQIRVDFLAEDGNSATNSLNIDYIRFYGKEVKTAEYTDDGILYDFNANSSIDGWKFNSESGDASILDGKIFFTNEGKKTLETCSLLDVNAKEYGNISISLQNNTGSNTGRLYFKNNVSDEYVNYFEFDLVPNDSEIRSYKITTGNNENWTGYISGLMFDFGNASGEICVDEIYILKHPYNVIIDDDYITVSGKVKPSCIVSVQISREDIMSNNYFDEVVYTDETISDEDGSFSFMCKTPESEKPQGFSVILAAGDELYYSSAAYADSGYPDRVLLNFNEKVGSADYLAAEQLINEAYNYINIDAPGYAEYCYNYNNIDTFGRQLVRLGVVNDIDALKQNISKAALFTILKECKKEDASILAQKYDDYVNFSTNETFNIYNTFAQEEKGEIIKATINAAEDINDFGNLFTENSILYGISYTMGTDALKNIIHQVKDKLLIDISKENSLKNVDRLYAMLAGNLYESYDQVNKAYNLALKTCIDNEKNKNYSASSGGGGGAGGGVGGSVNKHYSNAAAMGMVSANDVKELEIFNDLVGFDWAKESVEYLYESGIVDGNGDGKYMPADNITRAEFVKMITVAFDIKDSKEALFNDVAADSWYKPYIDKAYGAGIILGNSDGTFLPGENISRQDMAVIIYRAAEKYLKDFENAAFADFDDVSLYAMSAVSALNSAKIINGMPDGRFMPHEFATRAQTAVIIDRLLKYIDKF